MKPRGEYTTRPANHIRRFLCISSATLLLAAACDGPSSSPTQSSPRQAATGPSPAARSRVVVRTEIWMPWRFSRSFAVVSRTDCRRRGGDFLGCKDELLMTRDGGRSWREITPQGMKFVDDAVFQGPSRGWAVAGECSSPDSFEFYRTEDGGRTWRRRGVGSTRCHVNAYMELEFVDPSNGWLLHHEPETLLRDLQRTQDGGRSWTKAVELPWFGSFRFSDPRHGWLHVRDEVHGTYILSSTHDRGITWGPVKLPRPRHLQSHQFVLDIPTFFSDNVGILPATVHRRSRAEVAFYATSDGGNSWDLSSVRRVAGRRWYRLLPSDGPAQTHLFAPDQWLIIKGTASAKRPISLHMTRDGGRSWRSRAMTVPQRGWITFVDPKTAWLVPYRGDRIYRSTDGGRSWRPRTVAVE